MYRLLIADADPEARQLVRTMRQELLPGAMIAEAGSFTEAIDRVLALRPQAALTALRLGERSGCELVQRLLAARLETVFCITSPAAGSKSILQAMRAGARDFLLMPPDREELRAFLVRSLPPEEADPLPLTDPILHVPYDSLSPLTNRLLRMARENFRHPPVTLASLAESMHMNSKYLGRVFCHETGMKLSQYLLACRMEEARRLIMSTGQKVSVIAGMVGYSQPNRFYVHFKCYFGVSPGALRHAAETDQEAER